MSHRDSIGSAETIGVDLGGTKALVGVFAGSHELWASRERSRGLSESELVEMLVSRIEEAREAHPAVVAVGLGLPARVDQRHGVAISAVNLPISGLPIRELIGERVGLPVAIDNDGNAAALAEHLHGVARGNDNVAMLTIGTGVGGGLILDGQVYRGATGAGVELGHLVIEADGPPCQGGCPNRGCLEVLASGTALGREGRAAAERAPGSALGRLLAAGGAVDGRVVTEAALAGDRLATRVVESIGRRIGIACASIANVFEPDVIVVGGGAMTAGDLLLDPARRELGRRALEPMDATPILAASLGNDAGAIGAAALAQAAAGLIPAAA